MVLSVIVAGGALAAVLTPADLDQQGLSARTIADQLGHSRISMT
jgi:hypothetical protein